MREGETPQSLFGTDTEGKGKEIFLLPRFRPAFLTSQFHLGWMIRGELLLSSLSSKVRRPSAVLAQRRPSSKQQFCQNVEVIY